MTLPPALRAGLPEFNQERLPLRRDSRARSTECRSLESVMRLKAAIRACPSGVARKALTWRGDAYCLPFGACWRGRAVSSKKKCIGTSRAPAIPCSRLALMRFVPFSYFCTCWNVIPSRSASAFWLIASSSRRVLTRLPTCLSVELALLPGIGTVVG